MGASLARSGGRFLVRTTRSTQDGCGRSAVRPGQDRLWDLRTRRRIKTRLGQDRLWGLRGRRRIKISLKPLQTSVETAANVASGY